MEIRNALISLVLSLTLLAGCSSVHQQDEEAVKEEPTKDVHPAFKPIVIYELDDEWFEKPFTEIPYYKSGKTEYIDETTLLQHQEGHQPWLADPISVTIKFCGNLVPIDYPFFEEILGKMDELHQTPKPYTITTSNGIVITQKEQYLMEISVPNFGRYEILFKNKLESDMNFMYLQKIIFYPELKTS
jgi:hypothetical protein